jgi:hypothetical protein
MKNFYPIFLFLCFVCGAHAQDFKFGKVSKEEVLETIHPIDKDANAAVLYRNLKTYYEFNKSSGFVLVTDVHERIKIYNKDGFDWASKEVLYYKNGAKEENISGLKGHTFNFIDGKMVDEKLKKDGIFESENTKYELSTKFTMPAVAEGSVIEYQYSLRSPFVTSIDDMVLQYTIPINYLEVSVTIPEFFGFMRYHNSRSPLIFKIDESRKNFSYNSTTTVRSGHIVNNTEFERSKIEYSQNVYTTKKTNIAALKIESHVDYISNYAAFLKWELQFTKFPNSIMENLTSTWESVSKTIYNDGGYERELSRTNYFEKDLKKLLEGEKDPVVKAQKIYNFAKSKVKWNNFIGFSTENGVSKAFQEGEGNVGDINLMLTAMLRYAGLKSNPVLLSTKKNGVPLFPTLKGFNYVISSVELQGNLILLDATDENAAFGEFPGRAMNWLGRIIIDKEKSDWVNLMTDKQSNKQLVLNLKMVNDVIKGASVNSYTGLYAKSYRDKYKNINEGSYIEILEKDKGNIKISGLKTEGALQIEDNLKQTYTFELKESIEDINGLLYLKPLLFLAETENPFKADKREYPIIYDFPSVENKTVNFIIPEGYEVESLPESLHLTLNNGACTFKYTVLQNGKLIRITSIIDLKNIVYSPTDYSSLKEFYAQLVEKHGEVIVLKKS